MNKLWRLKYQHKAWLFFGREAFGSQHQSLGKLSVWFINIRVFQIKLSYLVSKTLVAFTVVLLKPESLVLVLPLS